MNIQATGDLFDLATTNNRHFGGPSPLGVRGDAQQVAGEAGGNASALGDAGASSGEDFGSMLLDGLNEVSNLEQQHEELSVQSVVDPDSVNPHDVTIAANQASLALSLTRNVVDRVVQGYQEITNLR